VSLLNVTLNVFTFTSSYLACKLYSTISASVHANIDLAYLLLSTLSIVIVTVQLLIIEIGLHVIQATALFDKSFLSADVSSASIEVKE
jgi:hypothetical protein